MISKKFYYILILRILILVSVTSIITYLLIQKEYLWAVTLGLVLTYQIYRLVAFLNSTNKDIAYHLKAMINEDFTLSFEKVGKHKSARELYKTLCTLNEKIQKVYVDNQVQEHYYMELIKQAEIGVLTINSKGHILLANKKAESLLNFAPLNHVEQFNRIQEDLYLALKALNFKEKLINLSDEKQTKRINVKASTITINNEIVHLITLQDIGSTLNKNEADSWIKLIRVLTHEIMNSIAPLTSISSSLLHQYNNTSVNNFTKEQSTMLGKGLSVIKEQSNHLESFVSSYRELLSVAAPTKKIIFCEALFEKVALLSNEFLKKKNTQLQVNISEEMGTLFADEQQIVQVLLNLIKNASESFSDQTEPTITIEATTTDFEVKSIIVSNNGDKIPDEIKNHIFIPFYTSKPNGSGVGLSLSRHIMLLHKGNLTVQSTEDKTSFKLEF